MLVDVTMPQLGESVSEGTITKWRVREGEAVKKDQPLLDVATDKADTEVPAPTSGIVTKLIAAEGAVVAVKTVICQIDSEGVAKAAPPPKAAKPAEPAKPAPASPPMKSPSPSGARSAAGGPLATPTARKAALQNDVDLADILGSGDHGRITKDDVIRASEAPAEPPPLPRQATSPTPTGYPFPTSSVPTQVAIPRPIIASTSDYVPPIPGAGYGSFKVPAYRPVEGDKVIPFTRRRRITADHMTYSKVTSPHVVTVAEIDLYRASKLREANKERYKKEGLGLTMLAFTVAATARALRDHPELNARVLDDAYVILRDVNIGVAVDSPDGLVVPVVRRADELGLRGIVRSIDEVAKRARNGKITIDDLSGATFSVTNPGLKGNLFGGAIINQPNVGILRMGEIQKRVVVVEGPDGEDLMAIHPMMMMALSYDHRVVDGVAANSFLWRVTELLEKADFEV